MITQVTTCNSNPLLNWYQKLGSFCIGKFNGKLDFLHSLGIIGLSFIFLSVSNSVSSEPTFNALPNGIHDTVGISSVNVTGSTMNVNADASRSIANWQTFNVGSNATVNFNLPDSSSAILNRVTGGSVSEIFGRINSNGHVFITNPSGILFGSSSQVNVGSLTASTLNINDQDFLNSKYIFNLGNTPSSVINLGNINASNSISLLGSAVHNQGNFSAPNINLAVGEKVTLNIADGITSQVQIDEALKQKVDGVNDAIKSTGNIQGDNIHLQVQLETAFYDTLVNNEGSIQAGSLVINNGCIELIGHTNNKQGIVLNSGKLEADNVIVVGDKTGLMAGSDIAGNKILIGGDYQGTLSDSALTLGEGLGVRAFNSQITYVDKDAVINTIGDNSKVIVWADDTTRFYGSILSSSLQGGGGGNSFVEVSGKNYLDFRGNVKADTLLLDPTDLYIVADANFPVGSNEIVSPFTPVGDVSYIKASVLQSAFNNAKVNISTNSSGSGNGDISFESGLTFNNVRGTFRADRDINLGAGTSFTQHSSAVPIQLVAGRNINLNQNNFTLTPFQYGQRTDGIENTNPNSGAVAHRLLFAANSSSVDQNGLFNELSNSGSTIYMQKLYNGSPSSPILASFASVSDWNGMMTPENWTGPNSLGYYNRDLTNRPTSNINFNLIAQGGSSLTAEFSPTINIPNSFVELDMGLNTGLFAPNISNSSLHLDINTNNNSPLSLWGWGGLGITTNNIQFNGVNNTLKVKSGRNDGWFQQWGNIATQGPLHLTFVDYFNVNGGWFYGGPLHIDYEGSTPPINVFSAGWGLSLGSLGNDSAIFDLPIGNWNGAISISAPDASSVSIGQSMKTAANININAPKAIVNISSPSINASTVNIKGYTIDQSANSVITTNNISLSAYSGNMLGQNKVTNLNGSSFFGGDFVFNNGMDLIINGNLNGETTSGNNWTLDLVSSGKLSTTPGIAITAPSISLEASTLELNGTSLKAVNNIFLRGDEIDLLSNSSLTGGSFLEFTTYTPTLNMGIGMAEMTGRLDISTSDLSKISNTFQEIIFGSDNYTGSMYLASTIDLSSTNSNVTLQGKDLTIGTSTPSTIILEDNKNLSMNANNDITIQNDITLSRLNDLHLNSGRSTTINAGVDLVTNGGDITVKINDENADPFYRASGNAKFQVGTQGSTLMSTMDTNGGNLSISPGAFGGTQIGSVNFEGGLTGMNNWTRTPGSTINTDGGNIYILSKAASDVNSSLNLLANIYAGSGDIYIEGISDSRRGLVTAGDLFSSGNVTLIGRNPVQNNYWASMGLLMGSNLVNSGDSTKSVNLIGHGGSIGVAISDGLWGEQASGYGRVTITNGAALKMEGEAGEFNEGWGAGVKILAGGIVSNGSVEIDGFTSASYSHGAVSILSDIQTETISIDATSTNSSFGLLNLAEVTSNNSATFNVASPYIEGSLYNAGVIKTNNGSLTITLDNSTAGKAIINAKESTSNPVFCFTGTCPTPTRGIIETTSTDLLKITGTTNGTLAIQNDGTIGGTNSLANIQISGNGILNNTTGIIEGGSVLINSSLNADIHGTVKSNNGDITILASGNNDSDINFIDANINSANNLLSIANSDILIDPTSTTTAGDAVFVVDRVNPFSIGSGTFSIDGGSSINAGGRVLLYTARPDQNFVDPNASIQSGLGGTFNQSTFATSASGPYISNQFWGAYYGLSSDPVITGRGIVGYDDLAHHYFKYGNLLPEMNGVFYKLALSLIPIPPEVILPPIINPFAGMMNNSGGLTNSLLNYDNTKAPDTSTKKQFKFIYEVDKNKDGIFSTNDIVFEYTGFEESQALDLNSIIPEILKFEISEDGIFDSKVKILDLNTGYEKEMNGKLELPVVGEDTIP